MQTNFTKDKKILFFQPHLFKFSFPFISELAQVTGIAAILRFPMPELEDSDNEDDSD